MAEINVLTTHKGWSNMCCVTDIIKTIDQPYGGLLPLSKFRENRIPDPYGTLSCTMWPIYVGKTVDTTLHLLIGKEPEKVFQEAMHGYNVRVNALTHKYMTPGETVDDAEIYIRSLDIQNHVDAEHMINVIKDAVASDDVVTVLNETFGLLQYEEWCTKLNEKYQWATLDKHVIPVPKGDMKKLYTMVYRTLKWLQRYDYTVEDFKFYPDGYTDVVKYGVGDFICNDIMFDVKCTKNKPTTQNTLQILVYYCMGLRSNNKLYRGIKKIGLYSPVSNTEWIMDASDIPKESIDYVNMIIGNKPID